MLAIIGRDLISFLVMRSLVRLAFVVLLVLIFSRAARAQFTEGDFNPVISGTVVQVMGLQTNGQVLIGGSFTAVNGLSRRNIARLNSDGSLDLTFDPGANDRITALAVQGDGKILVGGLFTQLAGQGHTNIGRLNADGSYDETFQCHTRGAVNAFVLLPEAKILIGGSFDVVNGQEHRNIARLFSNGSVDADFTVGVDGPVLMLAQQTNGDLIVAGSFNSLNGQALHSMGRLHPDGSLDMTFQPAMSYFGLGTPSVEAMALQPDGKILVGGDFEDLGGVPDWCYFGRLNADGSLDTWFVSDADDEVNAITVQADGKIVIGGEFGSVGGTEHNYLARLNPDGTVDEAFAPVVSEYVRALVVQPDTKILVGGSFGTLAGVLRMMLGRLYPDGVLDGTYRYVRPRLDRVWLTSGGGRQLSFANPGLHAFTVLAASDVSSSASNWTALGVATNGGDGLFQFIDSGATNFMHRFYQLRWP